MINTKHVNKVWKELFLCNKTFNPDINALPDNIDTNELNYIPIDPKIVANILEKHSIPCSCQDYYIGPKVTTYIAKPINTHYYNLKNINPYDFARELNVESVRISNSPSGIEIEIKNPIEFNVSFKELYLNMPDNLNLPIILGENSFGFRRYIDLTEMPHLLIAGRTGSGKSVFLNTSILSLICKKSPDELKLMLIDPKQVEFINYNKIPHLYRPILINEVATKFMLDELIDEMENRYSLFQKEEVKKLSEYNKKTNKKLPYIVCIIDEYADLVLMAGEFKKSIETSVIRLAQKARAAGIHLIIATQKPITQVLTTLIRSNIPARIAFAVCTSMDSKIILDTKGAQDLLGNGDFLFLNPKTNKLERIQAPFINDDDIQLLLKGA